LRVGVGVEDPSISLRTSRACDINLIKEMKEPPAQASAGQPGVAIDLLARDVGVDLDFKCT
jgi:hypothetical protein